MGLKEFFGLEKPAPSERVNITGHRMADDVDPREELAVDLNAEIARLEEILRKEGSEAEDRRFALEKLEVLKSEREKQLR